MSRRPVLVLAAVAAAVSLAACGSVAGQPAASSPAAAPAVDVQGTFAAPPGTPAVTYDQALVPVGAKAEVKSTVAGGSTTVQLSVHGLMPGRRYGAHAHAKSCGAKGEDAGPHFQFKPDPVQPSVDPAYANPQNEIWLDLTTDATGAGTGTSTVAWVFPADRRAKSVIVHAMPTATEAGKAGTAGARAACLSVGF